MALLDNGWTDEQAQGLLHSLNLDGGTPKWKREHLQRLRSWWSMRLSSVIALAPTAPPLQSSTPSQRLPVMSACRHGLTESSGATPLSTVEPSQELGEREVHRDFRKPAHWVSDG